MNKIYIFLVFAFITSASLNAQLSFTNQTDKLQLKEVYSGVAMGVLDMNGDGLDDIIKLNDRKELIIELQNADGSFDLRSFGILGDGNHWSLAAADINNTGNKDLFYGGFYHLGASSLDMENETMQTIDMPNSGSVFVQGSNFVDINNDGFLDIFACHDDGESYIWENDKQGGFVPANDWIDMSFNGSSEEMAAGNYGSTWMDIDNDGDIDLYIAKCRQNVTDPNDPRRINQLYINNGDGSFTEDALERGLAIGWQSWTADFGDVNNDGFLDCFITNHDHQQQLLLNDGTAHFVEVENSGIDYDGLAIQGIFRDFDNDGWLDVIVTGRGGEVYLNNKDTTFTKVTGLFDSDRMQSYALGDLNNDGYVDVYSGYANGFNNPSSVNDKLWINDGGQNNFVAISLIGVESNRSAIGARIELYGAWGKQIRDVHSGESYGIVNSPTQYFGLGQEESIDSIRVLWPSGVIQLEENVSINSQIKLIEGGCLGVAAELNVVGETTFCTGDSLIISAAEGFDSYIWSTGDTTRSVVVYSEGSYSVNTTDTVGCVGFSEKIKVVVDPILEPRVLALSTTEFCEGGSVTIQGFGLPDGSDVEWTNGAQSDSIVVTESGSFALIAKGLCDDFISEAIEVNVLPLPALPEIDDVTIEIGDVAQLEATGNEISWYETLNSTEPFATGNVIEIDGLIETTDFYAEDVFGTAETINDIGMLDHSGTGYSGDDNRNSYMIFDALKDLTIDSVKVYTDTPGARKILILNSEEELVSEVEVFIEFGESKIFVDLEVPMGENYRIITDELTNFLQFGFTGPRLQRSNQNVSFPYIYPDLVEITTSDAGSDWYYYFFDWDVSSGISCKSGRSSVTVTVDEVSSVIDPVQKQMELFPNPTSGIIQLILNEPVEFPLTISMMDISGKVLMNAKVSSDEAIIDISDFPSGMYIVKASSLDKNYYTRIIKN